MRQHRTRNLEVPGSQRSLSSGAHSRDPLARSGTTESINRRLADRRAEAGFEEIEIAAFVGLLDVLREHPAISAFEAALRLLPFGAAFGKLGFRDIEIDGACADIKGDAVAGSHQSERSADIGFRRHMQDAGAVARAAHA